MRTYLDPAYLAFKESQKWPWASRAEFWTEFASLDSTATRHDNALVSDAFHVSKLVLPQIQPKFQIFEIWYVARQYQKLTVAESEIFAPEQVS